jgi:hypothetical protein
MFKMLNYQKTIIYGNVLRKIFANVMYQKKTSFILTNLFKANSTFANYTNRFVGIQYAVDMSIIKYATALGQNLTSNVGLL